MYCGGQANHEKQITIISSSRQSREKNCEKGGQKLLSCSFQDKKPTSNPCIARFKQFHQSFGRCIPTIPQAFFRATSKCPCHAARCKAVRPAALGAETLLRPQRRCAVAPWPWRAARCKAVEPLRSGSSSAPPAFAPGDHRYKMELKWGALCKYVPEIKFQ